MASTPNYSGCKQKGIFSWIESSFSAWSCCASLSISTYALRSMLVYGLFKVNVGISSLNHTRIANFYTKPSANFFSNRHSQYDSLFAQPIGLVSNQRVLRFVCIGLRKCWLVWWCGGEICRMFRRTKKEDIPMRIYPLFMPESCFYFTMRIFIFTSETGLSLWPSLTAAIWSMIPIPSITWPNTVYSISSWGVPPMFL